MKKVTIILMLLMAGMTSMVNAQSLKFGHIDMQQLVQVMPERTAALATLEKEASELEEMLITMQEELQTMFTTYTEKRDSMSSLVRQAKEEDIQMKQQRIETFRSQADQQLQQKQQEQIGRAHV